METTIETVHRITGREIVAHFGGTPVDLRGANLRGLDLRSFDLTGANLSGADLTGAILGPLERATLRGAIFAPEHCSGGVFNCQMQGACLTEETYQKHVRWGRNNVRGVSMTFDVPGGVDFRGFTPELDTDEALVKHYLGGVAPERARFFPYHTFPWAGFYKRHGVLGSADLRRADLRGLNLSDLYFTTSWGDSYTDMRGARLDGCTITGARFDGCDFRGASLRGAISNLRGWTCERTKWEGADLDGASLSNPLPRYYPFDGATGEYSRAWG